MITLIAARARRNVIGKDGDMPWHLPEDLKYFMRETMGGAMIMGRNTWGQPTSCAAEKPTEHRSDVQRVCGRTLRWVRRRGNHACDHPWLSSHLWRGRGRDICCDVANGGSVMPDRGQS